MEKNIKIDPMDYEDQPGTSQQNPSSESENSTDLEEDDFAGRDDVAHHNRANKLNAPKRKCRRQRQVSKLNPNMKGLMGEANVRYSKGDIQTAEKMCFEVIRQVPDAYEPYITLAQIYEGTDPTKYEGYLTMVTYLHPQDLEIWHRLAELYIRNGRVREAITFYSKALKHNPRAIDIHTKRLELAESCGDTRFVLSCKKRMAHKLPKTQHQRIIELSMEVTKAYHEEKNYMKALEALDVPFKRVPKKVTQDLVNMMLELLLLTERCIQCLDVFIQFCNFTIEVEVIDDKSHNNIVVNSYVMPPSTQIDIKVKFIVCLIKLKSFNLIPQLIDSLICEENVETIGDLYLDVAEDLMTAQLHTEALKLLVPLIKSDSYSLAAVWLKYAECLSHCNLLEQSVEAYFNVLNMAPQHVEVLYPLAMALLKLDKKSEALQVLSQDLSSNKLDVAVLIERMKLLKQINAMEEYWKCVELLFSRHCIVPKYQEELMSLIPAGFSYNEKVKKVERLRMFRHDPTPVESNFECIREPSIEDEYKLFREIMQFALDTKQFSQMEMLGVLVTSSKKLAPYFKDIYIAAFFACLHNNDSFYSYNLIRNMVYNEPDNNLIWNLFSVVLQNPDDLRHNKFITRFQERQPGCRALQMMEANCAVALNKQNVALKFYMKEFKKSKTPFSALMLGNILLQSYSKRKPSVGERSTKLAKTIQELFLFYAQKRSKDAQHEVYYNLGRMYHQLGMMSYAESCYQKGLQLDEVDNPEILSLRYETAYNLHLIYRNSGNLILARNTLMKHVVI